MIARIRMYSKKEIAAALILLCANVLMGLTIWLGYKYDQIAEKLGKTPKSIDNALQRIKKKIGKYLKL